MDYLYNKMKESENQNMADSRLHCVSAKLKKFSAIPIILKTAIYKIQKTQQNAGNNPAISTQYKVTYFQLFLEECIHIKQVTVNF